MAGSGWVLMDDFADAYLLTKLGHPELAGWWGKVLGGSSGGGGGGGGSDDDGGSKPFDELTWEQVIASTKTGKYKSFNVGDMKELDLGSEGIVHMQIVGIDVDDLADGSGKAPLTFISKELLATPHAVNSTNTNVNGWGESELRTYIKTSIKPLIPSNIATQIKEVKKWSYVRNPLNKNAYTADDVWIPSYREVNLGEDRETSGVIYDTMFLDDNTRKKMIVGTTTFKSWWLRTTTNNNSSYWGCVSSSGKLTTIQASYTSAYIALGFCL